jgi:CBS domain-containing protein
MLVSHKFAYQVMGRQKNIQKIHAKEMQEYTRNLLNDIRALEWMINENLLEDNQRRIGVEQEIYLVDRYWKPHPVIMDVLKHIKDPHFVTEFASFNAEINLDPILFKGDAFSKLYQELESKIHTLTHACKNCDTKALLVGILPNLQEDDVNLKNMTPLLRYKLLNEALTNLRQGYFEFRINGTDEMITKSKTPLFEACNTSFQLHYQITAAEFVKKYNWALAITGPVLAVAVNSPLLFGKRLWKETRIALFEQSIDTRNIHNNMHREQVGRVNFNQDWVKASALEVFKDNVARFRPIISNKIETDSLETIKQGKIPKLDALCLHNGTVYKWNRLCYGVTDGKPHLRIENRVLPSGPSIIDEVANAALWFGLMNGLPKEYEDIPKKLSFDDAKTNFVRAARNGMETRFRWTDKKRYNVDDLIIHEFLPIAREGLQTAKINVSDIDLYLGIIEERAASAKTGSYWILESFSNLNKHKFKDESLITLTASLYKKQQSGKPVHQWELAETEDIENWRTRYLTIEQIMTKDLFTVHENDLMELVVSLMDWQKIRHIPVENEKGEIVGLLSSNNICKIFSSKPGPKMKDVMVNEVMKTKIPTISPDKRISEGLELMISKQINCLPVIKNKKLVGIITEHDFLKIALMALKEGNNPKKLNT